METVALIQARMGSSRFPGKVLEPIDGRPVIERVAERVQASSRIARVAVVTSDLPGDDVVAERCERAGIPCFRGSESDVLDRFHMATSTLGVKRIIRITADCPLIDPSVLDSLIKLADDNDDVAYASVATGALGPEFGYRRFPDGLDAEVISSDALEVAWLEAESPYDREHVTPFIRKRPDRFEAAVLEAPEDWGDERWTVDYPEDLEFVRQVFGQLNAQSERFGYCEILSLLEERPELRDLNASRRAI